jgi:hypothetical protein
MHQIRFERVHPPRRKFARAPQPQLAPASGALKKAAD